MLDTLAPTDPVLLLAVLDGPFSDLPKDVRAWFGATRANRVHLTPPELSAREAFFRALMDDVKRPPNAFPDGMKRRKRVLEKLPIAPPLEPRKPTESELALQEEQDKRTALILQSRLLLIVNELKRKFKRFTKRASVGCIFIRLKKDEVADVVLSQDEYNHDFNADEAVFEPPAPVPVEVEIVDSVTTINADGDVSMAFGDAEQAGPSTLPDGQQQTEVDSLALGQDQPPQQQQQMQAQLPESPPPPQPQLHDMDLEKISFDLYHGSYLTPTEFFLDILKIVQNAHTRAGDDMERYHRAEALRVAAEVSLSDIDPFTKLECERMAAREKQRKEDRRRRKGKDKEASNGSNSVANGKEPLRRSTRHNGPVPMMIQDPVALERQLKRRRGLDAGEGSISSDGEQAAKRSKVSTDAEGEPGPSTSNGSNLNPNAAMPSTPSRNHVRFAGGGDDEFAEMQSMSPLANHRSSQSTRYHQHSLAPPGSIPSLLNGAGAVAGLLPSQQTQPNAMSAMEVGPHPPSGCGGGSFNTSLLNPAPGSIGDHNTPPLTPSRHPMDLSAGVPPPSQQTLLAMPSLQQNVSSLSSTNRGTSSSQPSGPFDSEVGTDSSSNVPAVVSSRPKDDDAQLPDPQTISHAEPKPEPMQIERTPTPPLPDFHVDPSLLEELESSLVSKTDSFTVEQLEQLRATCLGRVWRHRTAWDRDALVRELVDVVEEFVDEVNAMEDD